MIFNFNITSKECLWDCIVKHQGETFYTKKGLPFTYTIRGGELFTDRRERSITRSTFEKAYEKLEQDRVGRDSPCRIVGPKTMNVYGAPYVWAVFTGLGIIREDLPVQLSFEDFRQASKWKENGEE